MKHVGWGTFPSVFGEVRLDFFSDGDDWLITAQWLDVIWRLAVVDDWHKIPFHLSCISGVFPACFTADDVHQMQVDCLPFEDWWDAQLESIKLQNDLIWKHEPKPLVQPYLF